MKILDSAKKLKGLLSGGTFPRMVATMAGGSLGQRVVVVLGLLFVAIGFYKAIVQLVLVLVGVILIWLAVIDYERTRSTTRS